MRPSDYGNPFVVKAFAQKLSEMSVADKELLSRKHGGAADEITEDEEMDWPTLKQDMENFFTATGLAKGKTVVDDYIPPSAVGAGANTNGGNVRAYPIDKLVKFCETVGAANVKIDGKACEVMLGTHISRKVGPEEDVNATVQAVVDEDKAVAPGWNGTFALAKCGKEGSYSSIIEEVGLVGEKFPGMILEFSAECAEKSTTRPLTLQTTPQHPVASGILPKAMENPRMKRSFETMKVQGGSRGDMIMAPIDFSLQLRDAILCQPGLYGCKLNDAEFVEMVKSIDMNAAGAMKKLKAAGGMALVPAGLLLQSMQDYSRTKKEASVSAV
jgi:hypothetical protein